MLDKVVIWVLPNGQVNTTTFNELAMQQGDTEETFIEREIQKLIRAKPSLVQIPRFTKTRAEIRSVIQQSQGKRKRALRSDQQGNLFIDQNYKDQEQLRLEMRDSVRAKFVALGLTEEEARQVFR